MMLAATILLAAMAFAGGCSGGDGDATDAGARGDVTIGIDAGRSEDAGRLDAGGIDAGRDLDGGPPDAGPPDVGPPDAGPPDAGECEEGSDRECGSEASLMRIGACRPGTQLCIAGEWRVCIGEDGPTEETCNGVDDDCDGATDEGVTRAFYRDADGDGFGQPDEAIAACGSAPIGYASSDTDCDDTRPSVNPGAPEVCNGVDDNCSGTTDEGLTRTYYRDADGDGFGDPTSSMIACSPPVGYVETGTDCDDTSGSRNPAVPEICDGLDNDCDGTVDEGCP
jgi:hypothetical protein